MKAEQVMKKSSGINNSVGGGLFTVKRLPRRCLGYNGFKEKDMKCIFYV